ncbi:phospholipid/cholesterol/gamma-HCH transport system substrate-binding protein [Chitinophaga sp. CF118]|uniref:MlaD family protein n=1 Tax=Chitinophaga sp. CF118 TaxID=1884367 RepID=UPI0008EB0620|nr:MlaD family protein [Chitinophaga sp. CF118]SFD84767.1 phospholipid/cholesterol/gamma-HCH transport system substrate-binding protein [Chitinophaga sp. CF118]
MNSKTSQKIKVGIFTLVTILLLLIGIFLIGRNKSMFSNTFVLYGTFKNVGGLQIGNNIQFVGINVGTVKSIDILSDSTARVTLRLQEKVLPFIKKNAVASISSEGLMGDKLIAISSVTGGVAPVKDGDSISTVEPIQMDRVMSRISGVAENAEVITGQLAGIVTQVNQGKGSVGKLLYSDSLAKSLEGTVAEAKSTMKSARRGAEGFGENMEALKHNFLLRGYFRKKEKNRKKTETGQTKESKAEKKKPDSSSIKIEKEQ